MAEPKKVRLWAPVSPNGTIGVFSMAPDRNAARIGSGDYWERELAPKGWTLREFDIVAVPAIGGAERLVKEVHPDARVRDGILVVGKWPNSRSFAWSRTDEGAWVAGARKIRTVIEEIVSGLATIDDISTVQRRRPDARAVEYGPGGEWPSGRWAVLTGRGGDLRALGRGHSAEEAWMKARAWLDALHVDEGGE